MDKQTEENAQSVLHDIVYRYYQLVQKRSDQQPDYADASRRHLHS